MTGIDEDVADTRALLDQVPDRIAKREIRHDNVKADDSDGSVAIVENHDPGQQWIVDTRAVAGVIRQS